jgi:hypothetical protein
MKPRFPAIRSHVFREKKFKIKWRAPRNCKDTPKGHNEFGRYDPNKMELMIFPSSDPMELLDTVLDETTHANYPDLDNDSVREGVESTMSLLKRMGMKVTFE